MKRLGGIVFSAACWYNNYWCHKNYRIFQHYFVVGLQVILSQT